MKLAFPGLACRSGISQPVPIASELCDAAWLRNVVKGRALLGVQKGLFPFRDDGQGQWPNGGSAERSKAGVLDYLALIPASTSGVPPNGSSWKRMPRVGRMWQTNGQMNTNLSMGHFKAKSDRPRISNLAAREGLCCFQANAGDTYGDTLYRNILLFSATSCKIIIGYTLFTTIDLFASLRHYAVSCKSLKLGLKIRRPLPAVGVQVPLWAPLNRFAKAILEPSILTGAVPKTYPDQWAIWRGQPAASDCRSGDRNATGQGKDRSSNIKVRRHARHRLHQAI